MTWTATTEETEQVGQGLLTWVVFTDGQSPKVRASFPNSGDAVLLGHQARDFILSRDATGQLKPIAPGTVLDLSADPAAQPPTADQLARQAWSVARGTCRAIQRGIAESIPGYDSARLQAAQSSRDKLYQASFEDLV